MDIRVTGAELRTAIEAAGIVLDGPIIMRQERVGRRPMLRAMFSIGGMPTEIHAEFSDWPPVATSVRGLQYVIAHPQLPRSEELHYRYAAGISESRSQDEEPLAEIVQLR